MSKLKRFSAAEMFKSLQQDSKFVLIGLVKANEDPKIVQFKKSRDSKDWMSIPERMITKFEHIGMIRDGEDSYPIVKLFLVEPPTSESAIFASALPTLMPTNAAVFASSIPVSGALASSPFGLGGGTDCQYDAARGDWFVPNTNIRCKPF